MTILEINPHFKAYVKHIGKEKVPLLLIEDIFAKPDLVREYAFSREFPSSQAYYPGRHQPLTDDGQGLNKFLSFMAKVISHATNIKIEPGWITSDFSIITTPEDQLLSTQGQPHIDGTPMLGVIYLNPQPMGGTVFFNNNDTNSMVVLTAEQKQHYQKISTTADSQVDKKYIIDSTQAWSVVERIPGTYNKLVMWPGHVFHSVEVLMKPQPGEPLTHKRLTQRIILNQVK